jgi:hypothetical protein
MPQQQVTIKTINSKIDTITINYFHVIVGQKNKHILSKKFSFLESDGSPEFLWP